MRYHNKLDHFGSFLSECRVHRVRCGTAKIRASYLHARRFFSFVHVQWVKSTRFYTPAPRRFISQSMSRTRSPAPALLSGHIKPAAAL